MLLDGRLNERGLCLFYIDTELTKYRSFNYQKHIALVNGRAQSPSIHSTKWDLKPSNGFLRILSWNMKCQVHDNIMQSSIQYLYT